MSQSIIRFTYVSLFKLYFWFWPSTDTIRIHFYFRQCVSRLSRGLYLETARRSEYLIKQCLLYLDCGLDKSPRYSHLSVHLTLQCNALLLCPAMSLSPVLVCVLLISAVVMRCSVRGCCECGPVWGRARAGDCVAGCEYPSVRQCVSW